MQIQFLGTGAAEGVPAAYCRCPVCQGVRERGGIEVRSRASIRIDSEYQIDIPPDNYLQMMRLGTDMFDVRHLMISHTHGDHLSLTAISDKAMSLEMNGDPLIVYISKPGLEYASKFIEGGPLSEQYDSQHKAMIDIRILDYFTTVPVGDMQADIVAGNHKGFGENEKSINYLLTAEDGSSVLYALDTGYYTDESFEYLEGKRTDSLVLDCTFAGRTDRAEFPFGHLDLMSFIRMLEKMTSIGFIDSTTKVFASHLNSHQGLTHWEIQERFDASPFEVTVAHDGLIAEIEGR